MHMHDKRILNGLYCDHGPGCYSYANFSWSQASNSQECIYSNIIVVMAPKVHHGPNQSWNCRREWCFCYPHQIKIHADAWESNLLMSWLGVQDHNHHTLLPPPLYHPAHSYAHTQTYNMYTPQYSWWASNTSDLCSHMWIALNGKHKIKHNGSSMQNTIIIAKCFEESMVIFMVHGL